MYAFSQVIAAGGSISKTVSQLEKQADAEKISEQQQMKEDMLKAQMIANIKPEDIEKMKAEEKKHKEAQA